LGPQGLDGLAETAKGKRRDELLWPTASGGYLGPPASKESWLSGAVERCQKADSTFPRVTAPAHGGLIGDQRGGQSEGGSADAGGHASAAMTLDVYADLFDSGLTSVAESVGKMWARQSQAHVRLTRKQALPADTYLHNWSLLSGLN